MERFGEIALIVFWKVSMLCKHLDCSVITPWNLGLRCKLCHEIDHSLQILETFLSLIPNFYFWQISCNINICWIGWEEGLYVLFPCYHFMPFNEWFKELILGLKIPSIVLFSEKQFSLKLNNCKVNVDKILSLFLWNIVSSR